MKQNPTSSTASKMAKRRSNGCPNISEQPRILVDRNAIMKLTKVAKSWDFTCSFCFKKFPSAQAMGGHQNAHRSERLEEKRLFVRDPIGYRKRAYIQALKSSPIEAGPNPTLNLHAAARMVKKATANFKLARGPPKILPKPPVVLPAGNFGGFNAAVDGNNNCFFQLYGCKNSPVNVVNFFPPKELRLAESVGVHADAGDVYGKACSDGGYLKLDLTLRL